MKKIILIFAALFAVTTLGAQSRMELQGEVSLAVGDLDGSTYYPVMDLNDNIAALLKVSVVGTLPSNLVLEVGGLGVVKRLEHASGEIWFYVPYQVKNLKFSCATMPTLGPIAVAFQEGNTYRATIKVVNPAPKPSPKPAPQAKPVQRPSEDEGHLKFKGVPIDGTLAAYTRAMEAAGFRKIGSRSGVSILQGDFAGFKNCKVNVSTLSNHDLVCTIEVHLPLRESWGDIYADYSSLKSMLTKKYGKPTANKEYFQNMYVDDDSSRFHNLKFDSCIYYATFTAPNGTITVRIDHDGEGYDYDDCYVSLTYSDKSNSNLVGQTAYDDL